MEIDNEPTVYVRERRQKEQSSGRLAALEALRKSKLRGEKHKYEPEANFKPVYDIVDEEEYSERVKQRQEDDWIINEAGSGYVEDGREIFDDDFGIDDETDESNKNKKMSNRFKSKNPSVLNSDAPRTKPNRDLISFFSNATGSKKVDSISTAEDENLLSEAMNMFANRSGSKKRSPTKVFESAPRKTTIHKSFKQSPTTPTKFHDTYKYWSPVKQSPPAKLIKKSNTPTPKKLIDRFSPLKQSPPRILMDKSNTPSPERIPMDVSPAKLSPLKEIKKSDTPPSIKLPLKFSPVKQSPPKKKLISDEFIDSDSSSPSAVLNNLKLDDQITVKLEDQNCFVSLNAEGKRVLKFYLLDACEDAKSPGTVYLFGRICDSSKRSYTSCSVIVRNVERRLWLLPREKRVDLKTGKPYGDDLEFAEIYEEIQKLTERHGINKFRIKKILKKYSAVGSLNVDAPTEADYLEIRYSFSFPALSLDTVGETFRCLLGSTSSALELFLLEQKIKGPRWLEIDDPTPNSLRITYCPVEFVVQKPSSVHPTTDTIAPQVRAVVIKVKTMPNSKNQHEIVSAGFWFNSSFEFDKEKGNWQQIYVITKGSDCSIPFDFKDKISKFKEISIVPNERALLNFLLTKMQNFEPDIIIGHDLWNFELETLMQRVALLVPQRWDRLGRLKRSTAAKTMTHKSVLHDVTVGRLICDIGVLSRELIKAKDYDLSGLVSQVLDEKRHEIEHEDVKFMYNSSDNLLHLLKTVKYDCTWMLQIATKLQCIPLAAEITRIVGGVFSKTLMGGRAERTEFLLLHALEIAGYVYPDKLQHFKKRLQNVNLAKGEDIADSEIAATANAHSKKAAYAGGLVLEPKKGLYDQLILLLDFNSLYPSIMQEYNICFTTIDLLRHKILSKDDEDMLPHVPQSSCDLGILPSEIKKLVDSRRIVKNLMKDSNVTQELMQQYTIRQQALKITANSMYGCLGFGSSRFYAKPLAALITAKGREILMDTKDVVEAMGLDVIYGDTDSLMINTKRFDMDEVLAVAKKVKTEVNKKYRLLELEMDGLFKKLLLLKKKKYAGLSIERRPDGAIVTKKEVKGLDIVRRDWSAISIEAGDCVLSEILSEKGVDEILVQIHQYLTQLGQEIRENKVETTKFLINKQLTKNPNEYGDKKSLPHVVVAIRLNEKGRRFKQGDVVSYLICDDGTNNSAMQRAYDMSELKDSEKNLKIDVKYYLSQQIHPVVVRLCEPIDGTDAVRIAECLGLDSLAYRQRLATTTTSTNEEEYWMALANPSIDFALCEPFLFTCSNPDCNTICEIRSSFVGTGKNIEFSLSKCANVKCNAKPCDKLSSLVNTLQMSICRLISKYYSNWMICDDVTCAFRTRRVTFKLENGQVKCPNCRKNALKQEVTEKNVYEQLTFYQNIFDVENAFSRLTKEERDDLNSKHKSEGIKSRQVYQELHSIVQHHLQSNSYSQIDLGKLFHGLKFL